MQNMIVRLSETPGQIRTCGPDLGEHNAAILRDELGFTDDDLQRLASSGVIANAPTPRTA